MWLNTIDDAVVPRRMLRGNYVRRVALHVAQRALGRGAFAASIYLLFACLRDMQTACNHTQSKDNFRARCAVMNHVVTIGRDRTIA